MIKFPQLIYFSHLLLQDSSKVHTLTLVNIFSSMFFLFPCNLLVEETESSSTEIPISYNNLDVANFIPVMPLKYRCSLDN